MPSSDDESMQKVHDDFEENLPPEVVKMREETAAFLADLERMGKMSPPVDWWVKRSRAYERMFVERHDLIRRAGLWLAVRSVVWLAAFGCFALGLWSDTGWLSTVGAGVVGAMSSIFTIAPLARARAFRSGYIARGRDDWDAVRQVCGDPVCREETQREFFSLDAAAMRAL